MTDQAPIAAIFGASGFLGRAVVRRFAKAGWRVRAGTRRPEQAGFLRPLGDLGQVVPVAADVRLPSTLLPAAQDARAVVNLAGILAPSGRQTFRAVHVEGAANAAGAALEGGAESFVHVSAIGADPASRSRYARTKGLAEAEVRERLPSATVLRPSVVFGPEDQFLNRFAAVLRIAPAFPVPGGGSARMQPVYVEDVAAAVFRAATGSGAEGRTYELGGPTEISFLDLLRWIREEIHRPCVLVPVPTALMWLPALFAEVLPDPPITRDQLRLLRRDSVVSGGAATLSDLDLKPTPFEGVAEVYLKRFRPGGR